MASISDIIAPPPKIKPKGLASLNVKVGELLSNIDLQQKSRFDFLLFRTPFTSLPGGIDSVISSAASVAGLSADLAVAKIFVQSITFPAGMKVEFERINGDVYTKDLIYPESVNIKFLDDERGLVMRYLQDWFNDIMIPSSTTDTKQGYVFRDNQENARRTAILLLGNMKGKFPPKYPRITFYGLIPKEIQDITIGQEEKDNLTYDVSFMVREVRITRFI